VRKLDVFFLYISIFFGALVLVAQLVEKPSGEALRRSPPPVSARCASKTQCPRTKQNGRGCYATAAVANAVFGCQSRFPLAGGAQLAITARRGGRAEIVAWHSSIRNFLRVRLYTFRALEKQQQRQRPTPMSIAWRAGFASMMPTDPGHEKSSPGELQFSCSRWAIGIIRKQFFEKGKTQDGYLVPRPRCADLPSEAGLAILEEEGGRAGVAHRSEKKPKRGVQRPRGA
jgi:hypothetical protein